MEFYRAKSLKDFWRLFFCLGFCLGWVDGWAQPRIEIDQPVWNFGTITNGSELEHEFVISNAGNAELEISHVVSSCNLCLIAAVETNKIPPGGTTLLYGHLNLRILSGNISREILVDCNDPQTPSVVCELTGVPVPVYETVPQGIELDLSTGKQSGTAEIHPLFKLRADLSQVICDNTNLVATVTPDAAAGFVLNLQARKALPRGDVVANLTIHSADSNDPPCRLSIWIHNPPDLEWMPAHLTFLPVEEQQVRILWLKQHGPSPLTLLDAIPSSADYQCEIDPEPDGIDYRIYVTASQQQLSAGKTNSLVLKMTDAQHEDKSVMIPLVVEGQ